MTIESMVAEPPLRALRRRLAPGIVEMQRRGETARADSVLHEAAAFFFDPARFEREYEALFRQMPLVACLSSQLAEPGTFRTFDDAGVPLLLSRGKDGKVRAFLNACAHRGARVVREPCGKAARFTCRFHGWTYDTAGKVIGLPEESEFCGEIEANKHLVECPAEERHGLVFIVPTPGAPLDFDTHLGALDTDFAAIGLKNAEVVHADLLHVTGNWKYGADTFFETYHLNSLHYETFKGLFSPTCVFDAFGPHHRFTFAPQMLPEWVNMPPEQWQVDLIPLQYFLFPNTIISVGTTGKTGLTVNIHQIFPQAPDKFTSRLSFCAVGGVQSEEHRAEIDRAYQTARAALVNEDYSVTGESHVGLPALPQDMTLPIGRQEVGVQNFHKNVRRWTGE
jgi:phenylpropionate dioxygenase-like ring-hydroxylating dioxygenase large terminal subunit